MSRIEELPDDFEEGVNLNDAPKMPSVDELYKRHLSSAGPRQNPITPKSFEEIVQDMSKTPLFMNSLDEATTDGTLDTLVAQII